MAPRPDRIHNTPARRPRAAGVSCALGVLLLAASANVSAQMQPPADEPAAAVSFVDDRAFLDEWQRRCFDFFWEQTDPATGMTADRAPADGSRRVHRDDLPVGSIASVGFGLTGIAIADERGWVETDAAKHRVETTLRFLLEDAQHVEGFFYHFVDMRTGQRVWDCELSSVDTALLLAGVLTVRQYYADHPTIPEMATAIYDRVNWPWMMGDGRT
ncbi:MAG: hypothetical protein AAF800_03350, partial [Planctomycetota bacterium]